MKEYEKLAEEYQETHSDVELAYISGFLKCREMALDKYEAHDMFGNFLVYLESLGEEEV